ncbi:MAG: glycoside hydrolase, partial [Anaerolineae bacterium]|nr:glycoside hydrolase [Anaerolineae bacterium]
MSAESETRLTWLVDPFLGNGASDPPPTEGLAATWFWPKAQTGNTHPGACYPYGKVSVCAYSGAYVTGYGLNMPSYDGQPDRLFETYTATGFAHFQQSGTGAIGSYYNYLRVTPLSGEFSQMGSRWALEDEKASPGRYSARLAGTGICAELTVSRRVAVHRYRFADGAPATIAVDVSAGGLILERMRTIPTAAAFEVPDGRTAQGWVVLEGIRLYFYVRLDAAADVAGTWSDGAMTPDQLRWTQDAIDPASVVPFGVFFRFATGVRQIEVKVGFSLQSIANARADVDALGGQSFDTVAEATCAFWETYLSRIQVM